MAYEPAGGQILQLYKGGVDTRFAWSGPDMISEISVPGFAIARRYVPGPGTDEPIVWYEGSGTSDRRYLYADERGSIVAVADGSGSVLTTGSYDEYGIPAWSNPSYRPRFGYTGQAWVPELGMNYYKARMYSPTLGRFMQTDPIGYGDGMNMYAYTHSDPVNGVDPTGTICWGDFSTRLDLDMSACYGSGYQWTDPGNQPWNGGPGTCSYVGDPGNTFPCPVQNPSYGSLDEFCQYNPAQLGCGSSAPTPSGPGGSADQGSGTSEPQKGLLDYGKDLICALPAISPGLGADLYAGLGGSVGGGINIDIAKGQFGINGSLAVGLGLGVAVGPGVSAGPSGSSVVSANLAVGGGFALPVAPGVNVGGTANYNVLGTDPGFSGGSIGRFGTPVGYVNGGANIGFNTPSLYDLGC